MGFTVAFNVKEINPAQIWGGEYDSESGAKILFTWNENDKKYYGHNDAGDSELIYYIEKYNIWYLQSDMGYIGERKYQFTWPI